MFIEELTGHGFKGKAIDTEGGGADYDQAAIEGFLNAGMISFVKSFPVTGILTMI